MRTFALTVILVAAIVATTASAAIYVEIPYPYTPEQVIARDPVVKAAVHEAIKDALEDYPPDLSYVVMLTYNGEPVKPDAERFLRTGGKVENRDREIDYTRGTGWSDTEWINAR